MSHSMDYVIIAHRGNSDLAPESTFDAFDLALSQGFKHFETDVQLTLDGVCTELKSEQPELPKVVADLIKSSGWLDDPEVPLGAVPKLGGVPGITITSFHLHQAEASKKLLPDVRHAWLCQELSTEVLNLAKAASIDQICPRTNAATKELVSESLAMGFTVRGWGIKDEELLKHSVTCGMQGATNMVPHISVPCPCPHVHVHSRSLPVTVGIRLTVSPPVALK
eukprot:gene15305-21391_t